MSNSFTNKKKILKNFLNICVLDGWNNESLDEAINKSNLDVKDRALFFDNGIYSLIDFFIEHGNEELVKKAKKIDLSQMKVRDKIKELVKLRILVEEGNKNAIKALITISKGKRIPTLVKNNYKISSLIWDIAGDTSTDFNFYSKRLILSKVFARTFINFANDESVNYQETWKLLDEQIDKIMKISQIKMKIKNCVATSCNFKDNIKELPFLRLFKSKNK